MSASADPGPGVLLDPDMPDGELVLLMGDLAPAEMRVARAAIRLANVRAAGLAVEAERAAELERRLLDGVSAMRRAKEFVLEAGRKRSAARADAFREAAAAIRPTPTLFGPLRPEDECRSRCADAVLALTFSNPGSPAAPIALPVPGGTKRMPAIVGAAVLIDAPVRAWNPAAA